MVGEGEGCEVDWAPVNTRRSNGWARQQLRTGSHAGWVYHICPLAWDLETGKKVTFNS